MNSGIVRWIADVAIGVRAAVRAPATIDSSLRALLEVPRLSPTAPRDPARALGAAHRTLRMLARIPGAHWRNTCLFRAVAECVVRRAHGWPAHVVIGVGSADDDVFAHSWVECSDNEVASPDLFVLRPAGANSIAR